MKSRNLNRRAEEYYLVQYVIEKEGKELPIHSLNIDTAVDYIMENHCKETTVEEPDPGLLVKRMRAVDSLTESVNNGTATIAEAILAATYMGEAKFK